MNASPALAALLAATLLGAVPQEKKLPVPDAASLKEAEKAVRDIFKDEYARKTPGARAALAKKLLQQGIDTKDNDSASFVLLRESGDLAAISGDPGLALQAISELAKRFHVNGLEMKGAALSTASKSMRTIEEFVLLGKSYLALAEEALAAQDYDAAERASSAGSAFAKKGKDLPLLSKLDAKSREAAEFRGRLARVNKAMDTLAKTPEDPESHFIVGHYLALVRGDWDEGLSHLARGSDGALKAAAEKELSKPSEAPDQIAVGDLWWDLSEKDGSQTKSRLRARAAIWYLKARDQTTGLTRTRIDKRLDAAAMLPPVRLPVDLLKLIDLERDVVQGRWQFIDGKLVSPAVFMARVEIPYAPPEEYDLTVVVECEGKQDSLNFGLVAGDARVLAVIDGWNPPRTILSRIEDQAETEAVHLGQAIVPGKPNTVVCSVRKNRLTVKVNDQLLIDWQADYKRVSLENVWSTPNAKALVLGCYLSIYRFSKISLTPVTGDGKKLR